MNLFIFNILLQNAKQATTDVGNGILVQQAMRESYARKTGALPNDGSGANNGGTRSGVARVKFGQEMNDEEFEEVQVGKNPPFCSLWWSKSNLGRSQELACRWRRNTVNRLRETRVSSRQGSLAGVYL